MRGCTDAFETRAMRGELPVLVTTPGRPPLRPLDDRALAADDHGPVAPRDPPQGAHPHPRPGLSSSPERALVGAAAGRMLGWSSPFGEPSMRVTVLALPSLLALAAPAELYRSISSWCWRSTSRAPWTATSRRCSGAAMSRRSSTRRSQRRSAPAPMAGSRSPMWSGPARASSALPFPGPCSRMPTDRRRLRSWSRRGAAHTQSRHLDLGRTGLR